MAENQIVGDQKPLSNSPTTPPTHGGGSINAQLVGDQVSLGRAPVHPPTHTSSMGEVQQVGDGVSLGRDPQPIWSQSGLPMSDLENMQGKK